MPLVPGTSPAPGDLEERRTEESKVSASVFLLPGRCSLTSSFKLLPACLPPPHGCEPRSQPSLQSRNGHCKASPDTRDPSAPSATPPPRVCLPPSVTLFSLPSKLQVRPLLLCSASPRPRLQHLRGQKADAGSSNRRRHGTAGPGVASAWPHRESGPSAWDRSEFWSPRAGWDWWKQ